MGTKSSGDWENPAVTAINKEPRSRDFQNPDFDVSSWDDIAVPSCWQMKGYNLTPYLKDGDNELAVQVFRWCDGSYREHPITGSGDGENHLRKFQTFETD